MRRAAKILFLFVALLALLPVSGQAQSPPSSSALYGTYPANYQDIVMTWLNAALVDSKSVKVKWLGEPKPGELAIETDKKVTGYLVEFSVNARNIFGAYTGSQKHTALLRDGRVVGATGFISR